MENIFLGVHHFRREMLDKNVVGEMMHHETLYLTGESVSERDIMSCCEMIQYVEIDIASYHEMPCLRGGDGGNLNIVDRCNKGRHQWQSGEGNVSL